MKKALIVLVIIICFIATTFGLLYFLDMNRIKNNLPVIFSTWGYDYVPPISKDLEETKPIYEISGEGKNIEKASGELILGEEDLKSFIGTVLEETTTYMIVEPNEDEMERKSSDKIIVNYGTNHIDYLYGKGRKVVITYNGLIAETYPAQIKSDNIKVGYDDFNLKVTLQEDNTKSKVISGKEIDSMSNPDVDLYYFGVESVSAQVAGKEMDLLEALQKGYITLDGIITKANRDVQKTNEKYAEFEEHQSVPRLLPYAVDYRDGGSTEYRYDEYTIIKMHTLGGDRDIYITKPEITLNDIKK